GKQSARRIRLMHMRRVEQRRRADEVADIGDDPRGSRLNEGIVPEVADIRLYRVRLSLNDAKQRPQRLALLRIPFAVEGRQQVVEPVLSLGDPVHPPPAPSTMVR